MARNIKPSVLAMMLVLPLSFTAHAQEVVSPLQPGATAGSHTGALPPPGLYFGYDIDHEWGKMQIKNGPKVEAGNQSMVASLIWSTPYKVLGANYAMGIAQPYKIGKTKMTLPNGVKTTEHSNGLMNTTLMPAMLSWDMGEGLHVGTGVAVALKNGYHAYENGARGRDTLANGYYTVRPNLAVSYFTGDYGFTMNHSVDFNARNKYTGYHTGNTYYLDLTATKRLNKNWTVGLLGNWSKQLRDDKLNGKPVMGAHSMGNRMEHVMFGPMVAYDFGKFSVNARFLGSVHSENDPKMRFLHLGVSVPLQ